MTACTIPPLDAMGIMESYVNDPNFCGNRPSWEGEPFQLVLPQKVNPINLSKKARKEENRRFQVSVWFVAEKWFNQKEQKVFLRWKYSDCRVMEYV